MQIQSFFQEKEMSPASSCSYIFIKFSAHNLKKKQRKEYANDLKELKVKSTIASPSPYQSRVYFLIFMLLWTPEAMRPYQSIACHLIWPPLPPAGIKHLKAWNQIALAYAYTKWSQLASQQRRWNLECHCEGAEGFAIPGASRARH